MLENYLKNDDRWIGFPKLINQFNYKLGIEIGVCEGFHCRHLLEKSNLDKLYGLDKSPNMGYIVNLQKDYPERFELIIGTSPDYAVTFNRGQFDFIHLDAWHTYEAVKADLEAWWEKVKVGGLFCGDDFILAHDHPESKFGVVEAVEEFFKEREITYYVTGLESDKFEDKLNFSNEMWQILKKRLHEGHKGFQIPQWWTIKQ